MSRSYWRCAVGLVAMACLAGCGGAGGDRPETVPVTGTVTLDGTPVAGATVAFSPSAGGGRSAHGITDANGRFKLTTFEAGDGAMPGSYKVGVSKTAGPAQAAPGTTEETPESIDAAYKAAAERGALEPGAKPPEPTDLLPSKYKDPAGSGLTAEVTKGGKNDFTFPLTQ